MQFGFYSECFVERLVNGLFFLLVVVTYIFYQGDIPGYIAPPEVKPFILYFHKQVVDQVCITLIKCVY